MKRVNIVGIPGAGKSTFARRLSSVTNLPSIHLDYYRHQQNSYYEDNPEQWSEKVAELIESSKEWIIDGNYSSTYSRRFNNSDIIIFLDYSVWTALRRLIKRLFMYRTHKRPDMPEDWQEKLHWDFIKYVLKFRKNKRSPILEELSKYPQKKTMIFNHPREAEAYLKKLERGRNEYYSDH